jgi:hypothetical protein
MHHSEWFIIRYILSSGYPNQEYPTGAILNAYNFEGEEVYIKEDNKKIYPNHYKNHFLLLRWWEHRTIEQLLTIKYAKIVSGSNYYGVGDIVEVVNMWFNNDKYVGGKNNILFDLKGHHFIASQLEPATKEEHDKFWNKK